MPTLTLYYMDSCPYCNKVLNYMKQSGISLPMKNVKENPLFHQELMKMGGKGQVPCLVIDGKALYESDDIIQWLKINWRSK